MSENQLGKAVTDQELIDASRRTRLENESAEYLSQREQLRKAEYKALRVRESVAQIRRELPEGAVIRDYEFIEGPTDLNAGDDPAKTVRLSELFSGPDRSVVLYQFMYGKRQTKPCPMCTMVVDALNGVAHHLAENVDLAIVAGDDLPGFREHARRQEWNRVRLLSAENSTFKFDLGGEDGEGNQDSTISVFTRDADGAIRHFYTAHPHPAPGVRERGLDLLVPVYNLLDLTPHGRSDWYASLDYSPNVLGAYRSAAGGE